MIDNDEDKEFDVCGECGGQFHVGSPCHGQSEPPGSWVRACSCENPLWCRACGDESIARSAGEGLLAAVIAQMDDPEEPIEGEVYIQAMEAIAEEALKRRDVERAKLARMRGGR